VDGIRIEAEPPTKICVGILKDEKALRNAERIG
jgi:hypothetical protein